MSAFLVSGNFSLGEYIFLPIFLIFEKFLSFQRSQTLLFRCALRRDFPLVNSRRFPYLWFEYFEDRNFGPTSWVIFRFIVIRFPVEIFLRYLRSPTLLYGCALRIDFPLVRRGDFFISGLKYSWRQEFWNPSWVIFRFMIIRIPILSLWCKLTPVSAPRY